MDTIQGVLAASDTVSKQMIKFLQGVPIESLVDIHAQVTKAPQPVMACTVQNFEIKITEVKHIYYLYIFSNFFSYNHSRHG